MNIPEAPSRVDNSFQLVRKLRGKHLDPGRKLISLDVVSLFTNIPIDLALESISKRWEHLRDTCSIPKHEFLMAVQFVLNSAYFRRNDFYNQKFGTPMSSLLSPVTADLVMQDLET